MEALQTLCIHYSKFRNCGNDAKHKWDFSLVLEVCRKLDEVTSAGKLFHVRAAATGNARSPRRPMHILSSENKQVKMSQDNRCGCSPRCLKPFSPWHKHSCDAWPVPRQTCGYLPSITARPIMSKYTAWWQRQVCQGPYSTGQWVRLEPATSPSRVRIENQVTLHRNSHHKRTSEWVINWLFRQERQFDVRPSTCSTRANIDEKFQRVFRDVDVSRQNSRRPRDDEKLASSARQTHTHVTKTATHRMYLQQPSQWL